MSVFACRESMEEAHLNDILNDMSRLSSVRHSSSKRQLMDDHLPLLFSAVTR